MRFILYLLIFICISSCKDSKNQEPQEPISQSETFETIKNDSASVSELRAV